MKFPFKRWESEMLVFRGSFGCPSSRILTYPHRAGQCQWKEFTCSLPIGPRRPGIIDMNQVIFVFPLRRLTLQPSRITTAVTVRVSKLHWML